MVFATQINVFHENPDLRFSVWLTHSMESMGSIDSMECMDSMESMESIDSEVKHIIWRYVHYFHYFMHYWFEGICLELTSSWLPARVKGGCEEHSKSHFNLHAEF